MKKVLKVLLVTLVSGFGSAISSVLLTALAAATNYTAISLLNLNIIFFVALFVLFFLIGMGMAFDEGKE